jgi:hypothetical protein
MRSKYRNHLPSVCNHLGCNHLSQPSSIRLQPSRLQPSGAAYAPQVRALAEQVGLLT